MGAYLASALVCATPTPCLAAPPPQPNEPITPLPAAIDSPAPARVAIGERLFNDPRLTGDSQLACGHCHILEHGGDDNRAVALAPPGKTELFNTPSVFHAAYNPTLTWRGSYPSLEAHANADLVKRHPTGQPWNPLLAYLNGDDAYREAFTATYADGISQHNVLDALAAFERTLITPAPFDRWLRGDLDAITNEAYQGYQTFKKLGCVACHQGVNVGGNLYQRIGIFKAFNIGPPADTEQQLGRYSHTGRERDRHVFRVPSLRNVEVTSPYFHDGRTADLATAITQIGRYQVGRELSPATVDQLLAFLRSLTGSYRGQRLTVDD